MSIMERAKKTVCKVLGHEWKHIHTVWDHSGENIRRSYRCQRCLDARKVTVNDEEVTGTEAQEILDDMHASTRAMMWLLDNVEPTASAETVNGKTIIKYEGQEITDVIDT